LRPCAGRRCNDCSLLESRLRIASASSIAQPGFNPVAVVSVRYSMRMIVRIVSVHPRERMSQEDLEQ
jgi:hypothetical protein